MAFDTRNLTTDYKKLMSIPVMNRTALAQSGLLNDMLSMLTPTQYSSLFPSYYKESLPSISGFEIAVTRTTMSGGGGGTTGGGTGGGTGYTAGTGSSVTATPVKPSITPSQQRAAESAGLGYLLPDQKATNQPIGTNTTPDQNKQLLIDAMNRGNVNDPEIRAAMAAVTQGESGFMPRSELSYANTSNERIRGIFTSRIGNMSDSELNALKQNPEAFFNHVYGGRSDLGNAPNEGYKYRGRGYFQLTGKANYQKYGDMLGIDLVNNPDLANDPKIAADIAIAYIKDRYENAPGQDKREKVFRAVGNPVTDTEKVKNSAFQSYVNSGEFAPGKQADLSFLNQVAPAQGVPQGTSDVFPADQQTMTGQIESMTPIGGDSIVNRSQSRVKEDQAEIAGVRKLPLQEDLVNTMNYAAQKISEETGRNISMQVFSGGQAALGTAGPRKGTTEHDLGGAGDVYYIETLSDGSTRRLSMQNPDDKKLMYKAAYHFVRAGGRSIGLESGYMGDQAMHLGISRNDEKPVHHGDEELIALVNQAKNEFLAEAQKEGWDPRYGYKNFFEKTRSERFAGLEKQTSDAQNVLDIVPKSDVLPPEQQQMAPTAEPVTEATPADTPSELNAVNNYETGTANAGYAEEVKMVDNKTGQTIGNVGTGEAVGITKDNKVAVTSEARLNASQILPKMNMNMSNPNAQSMPQNGPQVDPTRSRQVASAVNNLDPMRLTADNSFEPSPSFDRSMGRVVESGNRYNSRGVPWSNV